MDTKRFAAIYIDDEDTSGLNPIEYSRFKYGSKSIARKFGKDLARRFFQSPMFHNIVKNSNIQIVVCSSPYYNIPTATFAMKDYFVAALNRKLIEFGMGTVSEAKIYRTPSYIQDYGDMNKEDREQAISGDDFYVDANYLKDKLVIFLDDILITGAHEERIKHMIKSLGVQSYDNLFLYYAVLNNKVVDPRLENKLNYAYVKDLLSIDAIIKNDEFAFNTRVVKYIISQDFDAFKNFVLYQSVSFRNTLLTHAIANGYHQHQPFQENLNFLQKI